MKKLKYLFIILVLAISILPLFVVEAASTTVQVNRTITSYSEDKSIVYQVGIGSAADNLLGGKEGTLSIGTVNYSGSGVSLSNKRISGNNAVFTFSVNEETFTALEFKSFELNATVTETPTPTPTQNPGGETPTPTPTQNPDGETPTPTPTQKPDGETPSPTPDNVTPSPTPEGQTPSPTPEGETPSPSPTPTSTAKVTETPKQTAKPTKRPSVVETTKDPYNRDWKTQAPPTIPPDVTATPYATPVAGVTEEPTHPPSITEGENEANVFFIVCMCLILLLIIDLFIILWRKRMGCGTLINNGIARRKVRDDLCDYPESAPEQSSEASETTETTE